ncbi:MAG TPA: FAD-dependent oxidoreductase [Pyrinomonadaceae bacterium]|nr:FAD-dependent oxidoreductase [Pyrinomonadaceae bacterium]
MGLTRRQFLRRGALAVASVGLAPSRVVLQGPAKKVLILGAGMAGLVAGYELSKLGHDVTLLEARSRPGGRVFTLREPFADGLYAEAGAARVRDNHNLTLKYIKAFDLPLEPFYPSKLKAVRLDQGGREEVPIDGYTDAMTQHYGGELGDGPEIWHKIKGGMDLLPKAFAARLGDKIHYGAAVVRIEQDAKQATVKFVQDRTTHALSADVVLCTIPFSVLRRLELPALSTRKKDLIKRTQYSAVARVYVQTKTRFWESNGLNGFAFTQGAIEIWQPTWSQPGPRGILMTYARPGEAERITSLKESERITQTVNMLDPIFSGLRANFERGTTKCWLEDEWSRGAWGFVGVLEMMTASAPDGRIYFAGEHMSPYFSWIQGALASSLRAVKQIDETADVELALAANEAHRA